MEALIELSKPDFSHIVVAISERSLTDTDYHINFYKVLQTASGEYASFDYKLDAVQISSGKEMDAQF